MGFSRVGYGAIAWRTRPHGPGVAAADTDVAVRMGTMAIDRALCSPLAWRCGPSLAM